MNDLVKVRINGDWEIGNLFGNRSGRNEKTKVILQSDVFTQKVTEVDGCDVKIYKTLPDNDADLSVYIPNIVKEIQFILDDLFPTKNLKVISSNNQIYCSYDTGLTICPSSMDVESIGSFFERRSFAVSRTIHHSGYPNEPDYADEFEIGNYLKSNDAIKAFVKELVQSMIDGLFNKQPDIEFDYHS